MTHTPDFLACYPKSYGRYNNTPEYLRCAHGVYSGIWSGRKQCSRKNGHGPHGAYCKQHDPDAVKARSEAQKDKWRAEWDRDASVSKHRAACITAIEQIAAGHNDPRGLALSVMQILEAPK